MKKSSKQLKNLQGKPLNAPATNYCQMLQEIAEAQRFEVLYTDIPELSAYGMLGLSITLFPERLISRFYGVKYHCQHDFSYVALVSVPIYAFLDILVPALHTIFFPSHWLPSDITSVETMERCEKEGLLSQ